MSRRPTGLKPYKLLEMAPHAGDISPVAQRQAYSWANRPLLGKDRFDWPLLWTLPAACRLAGFTQEADYLAHSFRTVLFDPRYGRAGQAVALPRAAIVVASRGFGSVSDTIFAGLVRLKPQLQREGILVMDEPASSAVGSAVIGMGLPPETTFQTSDTSPLGGVLKSDCATVDASKWSAGQVLYLTFPSTIGSISYPNVAAQDTLVVPPGGGLQDSWAIQFWEAVNARAADVTRAQASVSCYDKVRWYVGLFDQGERYLGNNVDGTPKYTVGWNAYHKGIFRAACGLAGPQHVYEDLGTYTDAKVVQVAIREIKNFFGLT